jgi:hypothetical protein
MIVAVSFGTSAIAGERPGFAAGWSGEEIYKPHCPAGRESRIELAEWGAGISDGYLVGMVLTDLGDRWLVQVDAREREDGALWRVLSARIGTFRWRYTDDCGA